MSILPYAHLQGVNRFAVLMLDLKWHRHGNGGRWVKYSDVVELFHKLEKERTDPHGK